jgi:hypothetical protein
MTISRSPERGTFSIEKYEERLMENPQDQTALDMIDFYKSHRQMQLELEETAEWRKDNLEYDLRSTDWVIEKCQDDVYAQHVYAALCNNEFTRNEVFPILQDKRWSCSWRHAGGVVADIQKQGDYIDWYCSGIRGNDEDITEFDFNNMTEEQQKYHLQAKAFVGEGVVTDEIRQDFLKLGWIVIEDPDRD